MWLKDRAIQIVEGGAAGMAIKPILFNGEMVRAILDGRKTCTRRSVKGNIPNDAIWGYTGFTPKGYISCRGVYADGYGEGFYKLPYLPGDVLYVRETWDWDPDNEVAKPYYYKADGDLRPEGYKGMGWSPSIHMPKEAARIWLRVTNVRVERLQDITENGAEAEGAVDNRGFIHSPNNEYDRIHSARENFAEIWDSTIKKSDLNRYGWAANPWVWIIEFERCEKPKEA